MNAIKSFFSNLGSKLVAWWNLALAYTVWRVVFWWKKRIGWKDFGKVITATGVITAIDLNVTGPFNDGDVCFNVKLDPGQEWMITVPQTGRLTSEDGQGPSIHCEITPWTRSQFEGKWEQLAPGKRVKVTGAWGFDGVHKIGMPEWKQVLYALWDGIRGREPYWDDGWFEIHPVMEFEFIL